MARKIKYHTLEEYREANRKRSLKYYEENKELVKARARDRRRRKKLAKEKQEQLENKNKNK
ncbi:MAG: hypothetical protein SOZ04_06055 [Bacilli bacterium]|nr:hypothetical protein [Bacilli bacterium]